MIRSKTCLKIPNSVITSIIVSFVFSLFFSFWYCVDSKNLLNNYYEVVSSYVFVFVVELLCVTFVNYNKSIMESEKKLRYSKIIEYIKNLEDDLIKYFSIIYIFTNIILIVSCIIFSGFDSFGIYSDNKNLILEILLVYLKSVVLMPLMILIYINLTELIGKYISTILFFLYFVYGWLFGHSSFFSFNYYFSFYNFHNIIEELYMFCVYAIVLLIIYRFIKNVIINRIIIVKNYIVLKIRMINIYERCKNCFLTLLIINIGLSIVNNHVVDTNISLSNGLKDSFFSAIGMQMNINHFLGFIMTMFLIAVNLLVVITSIDFFDNYSEEYTKLRISRENNVIINLLACFFYSLIISISLYTINLILFRIVYYKWLYDFFLRYLIINLIYVVNGLNVLKLNYYYKILSILSLFVIFYFNVFNVGILIVILLLNMLFLIKSKIR